jgi:hypothetical protein
MAESIRRRPQKGDPWEKVKITCAHGKYPQREMTLTRTGKEVLEMMRDFFPGGPVDAARAHGEYRAWMRNGAPSGEPSPGAARWEALRENWENWQNYGDHGSAEPADWNPFSGVDFRHALRQMGWGPGDIRRLGMGRTAQKQDPRIRMRT